MIHGIGKIKNEQSKGNHEYVYEWGWVGGVSYNFKCSERILHVYDLLGRSMEHV